MDQFKKRFYEAVQNHRPELWHRCYPRIYEEPGCGQYYSPKEIGYQLLGTALRIEQEGVMGQSQMAEIVWASRLANLRVPTYWIGHDMAQAIQQTVPPVWFDWVNSPLPHEGAVFMVPRGILCHEEAEGDAVFVSYVRTRSGDQIPTLSPGGPRHFDILGGAFHVFVTTDRGEALMHWTYSAEEEYDMGKINLEKLDQLVQDFAVHDHSTYSMYSAQLTLADNRFMARVSHFVFGTLLLMLAMPSHVTTASLRKRVPSKAVGQPPKEFWCPNVIGLHYKIRRVGIPQGGTHASPRGHWVRGAHKMIAYGEKSALRKPKWIEPYWRGGTDEE